MLCACFACSVRSMRGVLRLHTTRRSRPFAQNINFFLNACTAHMGISKNDLFDVRDLYDQANFVRVLHTIDMVHRVARTQAPASAAAANAAT